MAVVGTTVAALRHRELPLHAGEVAVVDHGLRHAADQHRVLKATWIVCAVDEMFVRFSCGE